jgi:hypothetical protein
MVNQLLSDGTLDVMDEIKRVRNEPAVTDTLELRLRQRLAAVTGAEAKLARLESERDATERALTQLKEQVLALHHSLADQREIKRVRSAAALQLEQLASRIEEALQTGFVVRFDRDLVRTLQSIAASAREAAQRSRRGF